jgi:hypothetical protein
MVVRALGPVTNAEHPERGHRLSPTADLTAGLIEPNPPARIYTWGLRCRPRPPTTLTKLTIDDRRALSRRGRIVRGASSIPCSSARQLRIRLQTGP